MSRETDLAWAAGIIDGEGTIGVYNKHVHGWQFLLAVTNTDFRILARLRDVLGVGHIQLQRRKVVSPKWRQGYVWTISAKQTINILQQVLPYLVGKHDQAVLMLEARTYARRLGGHQPPNPHHPRLLEIAKLMKALKKQTATAPVVVPPRPPKKVSRQLTLVPWKGSESA